MLKAYRIDAKELEELWSAIANPPFGCQRRTPNNKNVRQYEQNSKFPKPSVWNIHQFTLYQPLEYFDVVKLMTIEHPIEFSVFDDFRATVHTNNPNKNDNTSFVVESRYEACTSVLTETLVECMSRATGLVWKRETPVKMTEGFPTGCRADFTLSDNQTTICMIEGKNGTSNFTQGLGQLFVYMTQFDKPMFGVLTDAHRFLFVRCDPQNGTCTIASRILYLTDFISFKNIVTVWLNLALKTRNSKPSKAQKHAFNRILNQEFNQEIWNSLEIEDCFVYCQ